jgi:hypothetical protein
MLNWIITHRRWLIPTGVAVALISVLFSVTLYLQQKSREARNAPTEKTAGTEASPGQNIPQSKPGQASTAEKISGLPVGMIPEDRMSAFSGEPNPAEVTRKLEALDAYQRKTEEGKLADLQVVWPLYLFSSTRYGEDTVSVLLDASESGFGVIIKTVISLKRYPGITSAQPGDRIWLAGKIAEVDTHGTGQITLTTEYVGFAGQKGRK